MKSLPTNTPIPLIKLPLYAYLNPSPYWYGLIPDIITIQGDWIQKHLDRVSLPSDLAPYINNAFNQYKTALVVAGNDRAYFALYSLRSILERVAMGWTAHSSSAVSPTNIVSRLRDNNQATRKLATQEFTDFAHANDPALGQLYDMVSQYFAHASKMDGVVLGHESEKDKLLLMRTKVLPLLLLLDAGQRFVSMLEVLLTDQGVKFNSPTGGRPPHFSFNLDWYVRICTYVMCERHSPNRGVAMSVLFKNGREFEGEIGINTIYRGGMEFVRFGDPAQRPGPEVIAQFAWYGIGRDHDDMVKVKCESVEQNGENYRLNWPKTIELDSTGLAMVAAHGRGSLEFFDYITAFLKVIEDFQAASIGGKK